MTIADMTAADRSLVDLLKKLAECGYNFVTPTPASHAHVIARSPDRAAQTLADAFGWNLPFRRGLLPTDIADDLRAGGMLDEAGPLLRSRVRASTLRGRTYLHTAYPTTAADAVFFGPDSYRFAELIAVELAATMLGPDARIVDVGTGSGVGAIVAAQCSPDATIVATDINPQALRFTRINAAAAGVGLETIESAGLANVPGAFDAILLNPPYIIDPSARTYRDGGGMHGAQLSLDLATEGLTRLKPGGRLILYTGSAIVAQQDALRVALSRAAAANQRALRYREIDPDVFGEELALPHYAEVDRIALIAAVFT